MAIVAEQEQRDEHDNNQQEEQKEEEDDDWQEEQDARSRMRLLTKPRCRRRVVLLPPKGRAGKGDEVVDT